MEWDTGILFWLAVGITTLLLLGLIAVSFLVYPFAKNAPR